MISRPMPLGFVLLLALLATALPLRAAPPLVEFQFHHDHVLGTSLDVRLWAADARQADRARQAILDEIERLGRLLSTYEPASQINQLGSTPLRCAPELIELLSAYDLWNRRSGGAHSGQLGPLIDLWKEAQRTGRLPDEARLAQLTRQIAIPAWRIDSAGQTITRLSGHRLNVDSLGKGFIISKAVTAARRAVPEAGGMLLNIGGDMLACGGDGPWLVGVADPAAPQDNAPPLTRLLLSDRAVATSSGYERGYVIAGRRYSHILDPRTGRPVPHLASATVIAPDNLTANALATTLCVLSPHEGLDLVGKTPGAECLILTADSRQFRSDGFAAFEAPVLLAANQPQVQPWPQGYQVTLSLLLRPAFNKKRKPERPYVAIWIETPDGKPVRTLTVWGREKKYLKDLPSWWRFAKSDSSLVSAVTRASRPAGKYTLAWDGLDDKGRGVPDGAYRIVIEVNREHGTLAKRSVSLEVGGQRQSSAVIDEAPEFEPVRVTYGPSGV